MKAKPKVVSYEAHTAKTKFGHGDGYGTAIKQPVGKLKSPTVGMTPMSKKQVGKPPKKVG